MASKNTERQRKLDEKKIKAYIEELKALDDKHSLSLRAIMKTDEQSGAITPAFTVVKLQKIEVDKKKKK